MKKLTEADLLSFEAGTVMAGAPQSKQMADMIRELRAACWLALDELEPRDRPEPREVQLASWRAARDALRAVLGVKP